MWDTYVSMASNHLRVEQTDGVWQLTGAGSVVEDINGYLAYLADRNYSPHSVRAYAFDLLAFARWLEDQRLTIDAVTTEVLLRFLAACRTAVLPGRPGGNVYSIRDGRSTGFAPSTINRRLAAISGLFGFQSLRHPEASNPVPRRRDAGIASRGQRSGLLAHLAKPRGRSRLRVREPRRLPRGLDHSEAAALLGSFRTWRDRAIAGLMLLSGLRPVDPPRQAPGARDAARGALPSRHRSRRRPRHPAPAPAHLRHGIGQRRGLAPEPDGAARPRLGRDEPALRAPLRCHRPHRIRAGSGPGQGAAGPGDADGDTSESQHRLAGGTRDQGPFGRWLLRAGRGPGTLRLRQHLRALSQPAHRRVLAAQRVDAEALAADAQARGWIAEADRHHRLIERIDLLMDQARVG